KRDWSSDVCSSDVFILGALSAQMFHNVVVIWFVGNFVNELRVGDFTFGVYHDDGTSQQTGHGSVSQLYAVVLPEGRTECRSGVGVLDAFGTTEATLGKWEVHGDVEDDGVVEFGAAFVEFTHACCADPGV